MQRAKWKQNEESREIAMGIVCYVYDQHNMRNRASRRCIYVFTTAAVVSVVLIHVVSCCVGGTSFAIVCEPLDLVYSTRRTILYHPMTQLVAPSKHAHSYRTPFSTERTILLLLFLIRWSVERSYTP
jgi:hypothetical protein